MFLIKLILLLFLSSSSLAKSIPPPGNTKTSPKRTDCHGRYSTNNAMVTFGDPNENSFFDYAIITGYRTYYPTVLEYALQLASFELTHKGENEECGWHKAKSVYEPYALAVPQHRGDVYWKYSDLRWISQPKDSNISSGWEAKYANHIPPRTGVLPRNATIDTIVYILERNEPAGDVYQLSTMILGWLAGFMAYILLLLLLKCCVDKCALVGPKSTKDNEDDEGIEGIELSCIEAHNMDDLTEPDKATDSTAMIKHEYINTRKASMSSSESIRSEPLPVYSVDGVGVKL
ncbi:hypothetical protein EJ02DRAFT_514657 [Clathrospora elynae]|uniref:Uncharacterized protein n=1 Tax=Clathrospora elynae TaxID=706981 RepID=A0A6A5SEW1_9PLEO|nr:hypothetical protein EJ02DRAFT_514657 [Clathrospora elynae]